RCQGKPIGWRSRDRLISIRHRTLGGAASWKRPFPSLPGKFPLTASGANRIAFRGSRLAATVFPDVK
ncbi:MAG: hypothetical protein WCS42_22060, partial [Verrucomicrobiota bacterium]